jgi:hypothetical protein
MEYEKPELISLGSAAANIQGGKGTSMYPDSPHDQSYTTGAYQADE